ncbi:MAG: DNA polymerase III subunit alpha [Actinobacteria bacterium]|nr:DNA polymerase III subunit alpha [Actinomycetota bacterium]
MFEKSPGGRPSRFVHLDVRSFFSLKDGAFSPEELAARAAELAMPAVALTDRDGLYGAARFVDACRKVGVRPILGATLTLRGPPPPPVTAGDGSVILLARDDEGYANLCRLITDAHMAGERGDPALAPGQVCAHPGGMIALLGPGSPPGRLAGAGLPDAARRALGPFREAFGREGVFVEVQHRLEPGSAEEVRALLRLAGAAGVRAVAANPVRYLVPEDAYLADALECMREIVPVNEHNVSRTNAEGWLKPDPSMRSLFAERPDLCDATLDVADACRFDLGLGKVHFPEFPTPPGRSASSVLAERCWRGMDERGMEATREARDRLDAELDTIRRLGYAAYFLTVAEIVDDVRAMGVRVACRGSAAGSLVSYLARISDVDPIRHGLVFERFINPYRDELPDIDIDVESARREDVYDMVLQRHGEDRAACVTMVETYRARAAIREVGKALGLPDVEVDTVAKAFPHIGAHRIREAIGRLPELAGSNLGAGQLETLFRVAERLNGFPRHLALHPSGIVLSSHDLVRRVPLERSYQGYRMIQADKDDVELLGYLKLDVLGVRMLSAMRHALDEVALSTGEKVDLDRIPLDDGPTFDLIRASRTLGCFQIESPGQRELLQKFQPERWEDLVVDISLFRPGPVKSDMVTPFLRRRHHLEPPVYAHPALRPVLAETHGVIVYHEQVLKALAAVAGYDLAEADRIRRRLDDEEHLDGMRAEFVERAVDRGVERIEAERVWREIASFASFGFCKAHAAAFAVPTYQSAWLKAHHPAHFLAGVLTHEPGMYPRRLILEDARGLGIAILPLDVNRSERDYVVEEVEEVDEGWGIRLALKDVEGMSDAELRSILEARADRPFRDVGDFLRRTRVSRPVAARLAHAGALDGLPRGGTRRDHLYHAMTADPEREGQQLALALQEPAEPHLREYTDAERVRAELEVVEMDASRHLLSFFEPLLADLGVVRSPDLRRRRGGEKVMVAGVKVASQTPAIRSGQRIIFLTLDDARGPVDVTVFESVQPRCARTIFHSFLLAVWGELRRTGVGGVSVVAEEVFDLALLNRARRQGRLREAMETGGTGGMGGFGAPPRKLWHASGGSAGW